METITLSLFCISLICCIVLGQSLIYALIIGLIIFLAYGKYKRFGWKQLLQMTFSGIKTVKNILFIFLLIGMLTALWRACGTIPAIIYYASALIQPSIFILLTFLLNCGVSILTGTSFGTAATMGVICMTMASAMQVEPIYAGGAILSGVYFGDRCSPVSTSALLVSELTHTDIFSNIKNMCRTALIPFLITCAAYFVLGKSIQVSPVSLDIQSIFALHFDLHWLTLVPAFSILVLSAFRINVKRTMLVSIVISIVCCLAIQKVEISALPRLLLLGYQADNAELAAMLNGGGISSMVRVAAIVCLSSTYAGIFQGTGLLDSAKGLIKRLSARLSPYGGILCTAAVSAMIACNQTLTIMLTHQLCGDLEPDEKALAIDLEDTAVVIAPLVPWSIAGAVPLATVNAPTSAILAACFLYLLPLCRMIQQLLRRKPEVSAY